MSLTLLVAFAWLVTFSKGYKILAVFPHAVRSHAKLGGGAVRHLLNSGHQITYITPHINEFSHENLTYVDVSATKRFINHIFTLEKLMTNQARYDQHSTAEVGHMTSKLALENSNLRKLMQDPNEQFDLVIAQWLFHERFSGFAALFNCPYIWVFPFDPNFLATRLIDQATHPAYTTNLETHIEFPYTFLERAWNLWYQMTYEFYLYFYYDVLDRRFFEANFQPLIMKKYGRKVSYDEIKFNASLILTYSHSSWGQAIRAPSNVVPVGGYHIDDDVPPLPDSLKSIMDNAKHGVIYFSMGSCIKSKDFPKQILKDLVIMFGKLKQTVLWKFEEDMLGCPENVHIVKWAPQQSVLAHPNCILFVTHGGLLSTTEAVHFAVPIIGVPVYYDQFSNVAKVVKKGVGKKIQLSLNFAQDLKVAIDDILKDSTYATKAKELSFVYHHRPVPPGKELVHWVEHVVATRGAPHLRSPALHMPWYQKMYVDLAAVVASIIVSIYILLKYVLRQKKFNVKVHIKKLT